MAIGVKSEFRNIVIRVKLWKFHISKHLTVLHFIAPFPLKIQIKVLKRLIYNAFTVNGMQYSQFIDLDKELTHFEIIKGKLLTRIGHQYGHLSTKLYDERNYLNFDFNT